MKIVLFDMDGTLTPARKKMKMNIAIELAKLQKSGYEIGIVTGSSMNYIEEQCNIMLDWSPVSYKDIHYFPCNGTKYYSYEKNDKPKKIYSVSMKEHLGNKQYTQIIYALAENQARLQHSLYGKDMPLTGNFIDCRGSMINWCPIGRNANHDDRSKWVLLDKQHNIRLRLLDSVFQNPIYENIEVKLGGSTSFDLFPIGWDKTYVIQHLEKYKEIYFIGDRCEQNGNDKELYDLINQSPERAFKTSGPNETIKIINTIIQKRSVL